MNKDNSGIAIGAQDKTKYDLDAYLSWKQESTSPVNYMLSTYYTYNPGECLPDVGHNLDYMGNNVGTLVGHGIAKSQKLVDLDSIFSNRNVINGKGKKSNINPINPVKEFKIQEQGRCGKQINTEYSRLTNPIYKYRELSCNRFIDLGTNPQMTTNYPFTFNINTSLKIRDRFKGFN